MGGKNSTTKTEDDKRRDFANHRGPIAVEVKQSRHQDRRPIVKVPGTNTRIIHVDPTQRKDIVPSHGYIAVEYIPSFRRRNKKNRDGSIQSSLVGAASGPLAPPPPSDDEERQVKRPRHEGPQADFNSTMPPEDDVPGTADGNDDPFSSDADKPPKPGTDGKPGLLSRNPGTGGLTGFGEVADVDTYSQASGSKGGNSSRKGSGQSESTFFGRDPSSNSNSLSTFVAVDRTFVRPLGPQMGDRIYFYDKHVQGDGLDQESSTHSEQVGRAAMQYELEEDEIHEMAGVNRSKESRALAGSRRRKSTMRKQESEVIEGEVTSNVLNALRMAIAAPMQDFRAQDLGGMEDEDEMSRFNKMAMDRAQEVFKKSEEETEELARQTFGTELADDEGVFAASMRRQKSRLAAIKEEQQGGKADEEDTPLGREEPNVLAESYSGLSEEEAKKAKIKRRKQLHKQLNQWKAEFQERNGRPANNMELTNDPDIRDIYRAYIKLKKETTEKKVEEVIEPPAELDATASGPGVMINLADNNDKEGTLDLNAIGTGRAHNRLASLSPGMGNDSPQSEGPLREIHSGTENTPGEFTKAMKKEMKLLNKEVKAWKVNFKDQNGKNPTKKQILSDPAIADQYRRLKELKALSGDGDDEDGAGLGKTAQPLNLVPALSPEELAQKLEEVEYEESIERRNQHADEQLDRRQLARKIAVVPKPTVPVKAEEMEMENLDETNMAEQVSKAAAENANEGGLFGTEASAVHMSEENANGDDDDGAAAFHAARMKPRKSIGGWGNAGDAQDAEDEIIRRLELVTELKAWQQQYRDDHDGEEPTLQELRLEPGLLEKYEELSTLPKSENLDEQFNLQRREKAAMVAAQAAPTLEEAKVLAKRRKELGKELSVWKAQYAEVHGKEPSGKDIKADPSVAGLYDEYQSIPKDILKQVRATSSATGQQGASDVEEGNNQLRAPSQGDGGSAPHGLGGDAKALAKRRKMLGKQLNAWKSNFAEEHGAEPTSKDIKQSPEIAEVYEEYKSLQKAKIIAPAVEVGGLDSKEGTQEINDSHNLDIPVSDRLNATGGSRNATPNTHPIGYGESNNLADGNQTAGQNPKALAKRRKMLGKQLNAWKGKFADENGRAPTTKDMRKDPSINTVFEEYQSIPKDIAEQAANAGGTSFMQPPPTGGSDNLGATTNGDGAFTAFGGASSPPPPATDEGSKMKELKKRKKQLGKELNSWKADFFEATDMKPKVEDIKQDALIAPVYEEYMSISKEIAELEGGVGVGDGGVNAGDASGLQTNGWGGDARPGSSSNLQSPTGASPEFDRPRSSEKAMAKRRKDLGKKLNAWKADFAEAKGHAPTNRDIKKDDEAAAWLEEYNALKKGEGTATETGKSSGGVLSAGEGDELDSTTKVGAGPEAEAHTNDAAFGGDDGFGATVADDGGEDGAPPTDPGRPSTAERKVLKKRLTKELNAWKEQFAEENGRNPKTSDIRDVPEVFSLFEQLNEIKAMSA